METPSSRDGEVIEYMSTSRTFVMRGQYKGVPYDVSINPDKIKKVSHLSRIISNEFYTQPMPEYRGQGSEDHVAKVAPFTSILKEHPDSCEQILDPELPLKFVSRHAVKRHGFNFLFRWRVDVSLMGDKSTSSSNLEDRLNNSIIKEGIDPIASHEQPLRNNFIDSIKCYADLLSLENADVFWSFVCHLYESYGIIDSIHIYNESTSQVKGEDVGNFLGRVIGLEDPVFRNLTFNITISHKNQCAGMHVYSAARKEIDSSNLEGCAKVNFVLDERGLGDEDIYRNDKGKIRCAVDPFTNTPYLESCSLLSINACFSILTEYHSKGALNPQHYVRGEFSMYEKGRYFALPPNIFDLIYACLKAIKESDAHGERGKAANYGKWIEPLTSLELDAKKIVFAFVDASYALPLYLTMAGLLPDCLSGRHSFGADARGCPVILTLSPDDDRYSLGDKDISDNMCHERAVKAISMLNIRHLVLFAALVLPFLDYDSPVMDFGAEKNKDYRAIFLATALTKVLMLDNFPFCMNGPSRILFAALQFISFAFMSYGLQGGVFKCWGFDYLTQSRATFLLARIIYTVCCHLMFYEYSNKELSGLIVHKHLMQDCVKLILENKRSLIRGEEHYASAMKAIHDFRHGATHEKCVQGPGAQSSLFAGDHDLTEMHCDEGEVVATAAQPLLGGREAGA